MIRIIGIPSNGTKLSDNISSHFGHCSYFIGIEVSDGDKIRQVFTLPNEGHTGCMEPVMNMKQRNVTDMILTGIGLRPFMGFQQVYINLFQGVNGNLEKNVTMLLKGQLKPLKDANCGSNSKPAHTH
jgi:predicted Fe-Mo cluster-binding NifX family protein